MPTPGIALKPPNPYDGVKLNSRHFAKVTDNNGENSEISGDPLADPFIARDGVVSLRSMT